MITDALQRFALHLDDELPEMLRTAYHFPSKAESIKAIHFPSSPEAFQDARRRLAYEELFFFQLTLALRLRNRQEKSILRKPAPGVLAHNLRKRLPYQLTEDQKKRAARNC